MKIGFNYKTLKKFVVMNEIDKYMRKNNFYQGDLYE